MDAIGKESDKNGSSQDENEPLNFETENPSFILASSMNDINKPQPSITHNFGDVSDEKLSNNKENKEIETDLNNFKVGDDDDDDDDDENDNESKHKTENRNEYKVINTIERDSESADEADIIMDTTKGTNLLPIKSKTLELLKLLNPSNLLRSHDLLLGSFYEEHKYELIKQKNLVLRVITWNLNQMKPPSLKELAGESGRDWAAFFYAGDSTLSSENKEGLADIYVINFQETISLRSFSKSDLAIDEWVNFLLSVLNAISSESYTLVYKSGLLALTTIVLAKDRIAADHANDLDGQLHDFRENTLGLGYLRWANKGCISIRFRIGGVSLGVGTYKINQNLKGEENNNPYGYTFDELDETVGKLPGVEVQILNVHLVHGENDSQIQQRWDSWSKIERKIGLDDRTVELTLDSSSLGIKDAAQERLEQKLNAKLHSNRNIDHSNYNMALEKEMEQLSFNDDSVRSSSVPLRFSRIEQQKFEGLISDVDLSKFKAVTEAQKALVVCGDTNYRLSIQTDAQSQTLIHEFVKQGSWDTIVSHDQLTREINLKKLFIGFTEPKINFAPTFKIINDSSGQWLSQTSPPSDTTPTPINQKRFRKPVPKNPENSTPYYIPRYDPKRLPAYTDRILYVKRPYFDLVDSSYSSVAVKGSDHLPVAATYTLDAPLVNENKLHELRQRFTNAWNAVINKLSFFTLDESVNVVHTIQCFGSDLDSTKSIIQQSVTMNGGYIEVHAMSGESVNIVFNIKNIIDESFNLSVNEQNGGRWFGTKIGINCKQADSDDKHNTLNDYNTSCTIKSHSEGQIVLSLNCSSTEVLERTFIAEIPEFSLCPAYRKYIALTVDIRDIFGTSFEKITDQQFRNILECFDFVFKNSDVHLLARMKSMNNTADFNVKEWDLVREITLWEFSESKYSKLNETGNTLDFNKGTITVMAFLYIWLKSQSHNFNITSKRGKVFFGNIIKLVKYFKMDAEQGYSWFGWLFADEYELNTYLDRDFDAKLQL